MRLASFSGTRRGATISACSRFAATGPTSLERSELLAGLDHAHLLTFVGLKPMTRAVTEYRAAVGRGA